MWKSEWDFYLGLYGGILADIAIEYRNDTQEWMRDKQHLRSIVATDGSKFFTMILPAAGKHFDRCLSTGTLLPYRLAHFRAWRKGGAIPRLFRALHSRVFDESGVLRSNPDSGAVAHLRQLFYAAKKVRQDCDEKAVYTTISSFWEVETNLRKPSLDWDGDSLFGDSASHVNRGYQVSLRRASGAPGLRPTPRVGQQLEFLLSTLTEDNESNESDDKGVFDRLVNTTQQVADWLAYRIGRYEPLDHRPKHGPGAVADYPRGAKDKYLFPNWPAKLEAIFGVRDFAFANISDSLRSENQGRLNAISSHEPPAKLIAVPKTQKAPRLIASEPIAHQWCQQSVKDFLVRAVETSSLRNCINFFDQSPSQELALQGSRDGSLATIDLSEASDRLSCWLVERLFRANVGLLEAFHAVRTRWIVQRLDKKTPRHIKLRKFSTMGSALTFPVQSIVFAMVAMSVRIHRSGRPVNAASIDWASRQVRVFGDDIICPAEDFSLLCQALVGLGLKVNDSKSFAVGNFRESCGVDAFQGVDVTPGYVLELCPESTPESVASTIEVSNNLFRKGYWRASEWMLSTLSEQLVKKLAVMPAGSGGLSLFSYCGRRVDHLRKRWNDSLQNWEFKYLSTRSRVKGYERQDSSTLLQYFVEHSFPDALGVIPKHQLGFFGRPRVQLNVRWGALESAVE
jgi:hypothetical protein